MQGKNLYEKLPIYCFQKLPKLYSFCLKQMLREFDVYFRFYKLQSVPAPMKMHENEGGGVHSDANKILQRHDIDRSRVSF